MHKCILNFKSIPQFFHSMFWLIKAINQKNYFSLNLRKFSNFLDDSIMFSLFVIWAKIKGRYYHPAKLCDYTKIFSSFVSALAEMRNHLNDLTKYKIYTHSTFRRLFVRQLKRQLICKRQNQHSFFSFLIVRLTSLMYNFISNVKIRNSK